MSASIKNGGVELISSAQKAEVSSNSNEPHLSSHVVAPTSDSQEAVIHDAKNKYPINLSFSDVCYSITLKDKKTKVTEEKKILKDITGEACGGDVVAIMGPTGSGKTSLLNILAKRCPITNLASLTGSMRVNDQPIDDKMFYRLTSYVMQDDAMFAELTVFETLMIAAQFQLSKHMTFEEKKMYVMR